MTAACLLSGGECVGTVPAGAPVALCEGHLLLVAEWIQQRDGLTDLLPSPCRACGARLGVHYPSGWICAVCEWRVGELVDGELPPPRIDVVYYLRRGDRIKIGTTANPRQRFAAVSHDEVMAFERGDRRREQQRHLEFAGDRLGTSEWFARSPAIDARIVALSAGHQDPWDLHARWVSEALALRG